MAEQMSVQMELEFRVLGSLLSRPDWIGEEVTVLGPEDFPETDCGDIFAAMRSLFLDGKPVTPMAVVLEAGDASRDVVKAIRSQPLAAAERGEFASLADKLQARNRLRRVTELAGALAISQNREPEYIGHMVDEINAAMSRRRESRAVSMGQAAVDFIGSLDETPAFLPWGIRRLDESLEVEAGDFVVIGGYASSGKTLLSLQMALGLAEAWRVGYFSLETSTRKLFDRLVSHKAGVSLKKIKRRQLAAAEYDALTKAVTTMDKLPLELVQAGGMSVTDIQAITLQKRYQVIFVDYLQLADAPGRDRYEKGTAISIGLHTLAQAHGVTVIALAQLSRPERTKTREGKMIPPSMSSFRESGQIEQDADVAMLLYPTDPDNNASNRVLKVSKNKDGEKLSMELTFDGATQTLTPVSGDKAVAQKLANDGRKAREHNRQQALAGFQELDDDEEYQFKETYEGVPF